MRAQRSPYSALVHATLGWTGVALFETSLVSVLLGVCVAFQIQAADLLRPLLHLGQLQCVVAPALPLAPLVVQRSLRGVSWISAAGLAVLSIGLAAVAIYGLSAYGVPPPPPSSSRLPSPAGAAEFLGVALFSFGLQSIVLTVGEGMREPGRAQVPHMPH